jgi:mitochondrial-processing peptidase subunit alpha
LEVGGWHSDHLVTACVLQTLLGGGSSFSAGGPGKGMYSRLYRQVLNQYRWAESAEAFTAFHADSGLMGISGSTQPNKARDMVQVFCHHLSKLAVEPVSAQELDRARNMLKNNVLTQLESRLILFEDMARQVLTYGKREHVRETCEKINAVTAADVQAMAETVLQKPPTVAAVGVDVQYVPQQEEVVQWLHR